MDDLSIQSEEIEALCSIYGSDWVCDDEAARNYHIIIKEGVYEVSLYISLPFDYPTQSPPGLELSAPALSRSQKQTIGLTLDDAYLESIGEPILYQWIEKVRELLFSITSVNECDTPVPTKSDPICKNLEVPVNNNITTNICHGNVVIDRKSTFQGHATKVFSLADVQLMLDSLKLNKKISQATHNILAYRIKDPKTNCVLQDFDDDGETHAGKRLLHLLNILDIHNIAIVVSRWYGGIHLGPDRFRHINNAARQVLEEAEFIKKK